MIPPQGAQPTPTPSSAAGSRPESKAPVPATMRTDPPTWRGGGGSMGSVHRTGWGPRGEGRGATGGMKRLNNSTNFFVGSIEKIKL